MEMGPALIGREDPDISAAIHDVLAAEGIGLRLNARCISLAASGGDMAAMQKLQRLQFDMIKEWQLAGGSKVKKIK